MDRLSKTARLVHCLAGQEASALGFDVIEPSHIFLGLCQGAALTPAFLREFSELVTGSGPSRDELIERFGQIGALLKGCRLEPQILKEEFASFLGPGLLGSPSLLTDQVFQVDAESLKLFRRAGRLAVDCGSAETEPVHLFWALLARAGLVRAFLSELEVDIAALQADCQSHALSTRGSVLAAIPLLPREREVQALAQALVRMDRKAVMVIGEEGVGRTSLVNSFALALSEGDLPPGLLRHLEGKAVVQVEPSEEMEISPHSILFVDDFHHYWPAFGRHLLETGAPLIGVSTPHDFERVIGSARGQFEQVWLNEPSQDETIQMVAARVPMLEDHYGLRISSEALEAAVRLPHKFLSDSALPGKAFNTLHQACVASLSDLPPVVTPQVVAQIVAAGAKLPLERVTLQAGQATARLRRELEETIIGQSEAIGTVCDTLARVEQGLSDPERPDAVFLLLGPTGVGKSELARRVGEGLVGDRRFFSFDMSEYGSAHEASKLIGAPPGYVGHERTGRLCDVVMKNPHCVLLFDEIEKAHPTVLDLFLQVFDEGRLVDNLGRRVNFRHATIFMTSNLGAKPFSDLGLRHRETAREDEMLRDARKSLRPELWNRIDEVVVFRPLDQDAVRRIAENLVSTWNRRLRVGRNVGIEVTPAALDLLVELGYSPDLGAREMRRAIEREVAGLVGRWLEREAVGSGTVLRLDAAGKSLVVR